MSLFHKNISLMHFTATLHVFLRGEGNLKNVPKCLKHNGCVNVQERSTDDSELYVNGGWEIYKSIRSKKWCKMPWEYVQMLRNFILL